MRAPEPIQLASGRICTFLEARTQLLRNYFVLTFAGDEPSRAEENEMLSIAARKGREMALACCGNEDAFTLIHSGHGARRVEGWHVHIVVVRSRWEKAWLYLILGGKNILQALGLRHDTRNRPAAARGTPASRHPD